MAWMRSSSADAAPPHAPARARGGTPATAAAAARTGRVAGSWLAPLVGAGVALLLALAVLLVGVIQYRATLDAELTRAELLARVLDDDATRTFESAALALASLADVVAARETPGADLDARLAEAMLGLPALRGVAVIGEDGRVLAASTAGDRGRRIDQERLGPWPAHGNATIGAPLPGRGIAALADGAAAGAPAGLAFVPLLRAVDLPSGRRLLLVGMVNPDALANTQELTLQGEDEGARAMLASYGGRVLAATRAAAAGPGGSLEHHAVWRGALAARAHGSLLADAPGGEKVIVAYRASRRLPLVSVVEEPYAGVIAHWWVTMRWPLAFAALGLALVAALSALAWRHLRVREHSRRQLDAAQARIARSERELSVLVRSVQELMFRTDADGVIRFANQRWAKLRGEAPSEAVGRRLADLVAPDCAEAVAALFRDGGGDRPRTARARLPARDGHIRHLEIAVVPLHDDGGLAGYAGSAVDVSDRLQAEQRLQAQLAMTQLLLDVSPVPVAHADAGGRLVAVNQAWESFFGVSRTHALGRPASAYQPHGLLEAAAREQPLHGGERTRREARLRHVDGTLRDVVVTEVAIAPAAQGRGGSLTLLLDVSEYRAAERATREARDAAEEASRAKSEFIANISHELRTPLQSIVGFSELGLARGRAQAPLAGMFADIHSAGQRMLALVNDLLDVSKIESTVGTFHLERTDLRCTARAAARELEPLLAGKRLRLQLDLGDDPLVAKVDPMRLLQVLRNVLANAIKFSPPDATITLGGELTVAGEILLGVRDHGPGIPPQELENIFEAFVQSSRTKDGSGGTGLGLAICRKILDAHGGHIRARNADGGGAAFDVFLPRAQSSDTLPMPL